MWVWIHPSVDVLGESLPFGAVAFAATELAVWLEASHYRSLGRLRTTWEVLQRQDLVSGGLALKRGSYQIQCQDMGLSTNDKNGE